jgi:hypothetical protein
MVKKSRLLSFVCFFALLAVTAAASPASAGVDLKINDIPALLGSSTLLGTGGGTYIWNDTNNELTLTGPIVTDMPFHFSSNGDVTIKIRGSVSIEVSGSKPAIQGVGVNVTIQGTDKTTDTLTLGAAQNSGLLLGGGGLTVSGITLNATGTNSSSTAISPYDGNGYAGIWVAGSSPYDNSTGKIDIQNADVVASGSSASSAASETTFPNQGGPAFGLFATAKISITGNSVVTATAKQTGSPYGGRAAGIFSKNAGIAIEDTASVTADATSKSAAAAGIYSEYGKVEIDSTGKVDAAAESESGDPNENQGLGIAAGGDVAIKGATVIATGTSTIGESAGIAANVPGDNNSNTPPRGNAVIDNAIVTAAGFGPEGHGVVVEGAGDVVIKASTTVTAIAQGAGYAIDAENIVNSGTANLYANDETRYYKGDLTGDGTITTQPNTPPTTPETPPDGDDDDTPPPSSGGCDAGFGSFAALFAAGILLPATRRKRS